MRILVVGGGAREHALVWKLAGERQVSEVISAPGNAGIARLARTLPVDPGDPAAVLDLAEREDVDLTVVGPEAPLAHGVADRFAGAGRLLFGPGGHAARLEASKVFAKEFMARHGVPTARCQVCETSEDALKVIAGGTFGYPIVIKADGLAAGKGVVIGADRGEAERAIRGAMIERRFGSAGARVVIEEHLSGREASFFVIADGRRAIPLASAEDHKRVFDGDRGPNTGGMGAFAPSPLVDRPLADRIMREIVAPVVEGMRAEGHEYRGFLYVGLMLTPDGPKVIEFNVRLGDPEAQVVLPALDEDLWPMLAEAASGQLSRSQARLGPDRLVGVVLASGGYPESSNTGHVIQGLDEAERTPAVIVFHAGTARRGADVVTAGGRVLTVVGRGTSYEAAMHRAYDAVSKISFEGMQYRRDIGVKAELTDQRGNG